MGFFNGTLFLCHCDDPGGKLIKTWGPRRLALLGGLVLGVGYFSAGIMGGSSFWNTIICIGMIGGSGIGLAYVVPIAVGMQWFPDRKGMITGAAVAGFGFGALLWIYLAGSWGHLLERIGLSGTFTVYGIIFAVMITLGGLFMIFPPEGWKPPGWEKEETGTANSANEMSSGEMLRTVQFYQIFITFLFSAGAGLMAIGLMKLYPMEALQAAGYSGEKASVIAGTAMAVFYSIANGLGRIGWGTISDYLGRKSSLVIMTAIQGVVMISFSSMAGTPALLFLGAALIGFNFGGNFALFPSITADTFGTASIGNNYPWIFLAYGIGGIAGPILGGILGDMGQFPTAYVTCGIACLGVSLLIGLLKNPALSPSAESEIAEASGA